MVGVEEVPDGGGGQSEARGCLHDRLHCLLQDSGRYCQEGIALIYVFFSSEITVFFICQNVKLHNFVATIPFPPADTQIFFSLNFQLCLNYLTFGSSNKGSS